MSFKFVVLFCSLVAQLATVTECVEKLFDETLCGFQQWDDYYHGEEIGLEEFPWLAALVYKPKQDDSEKILCGGSLISRYYVLTSAQCLKPQSTQLVAVRFGAYNITNPESCAVGYGGITDCSTAVDSEIKEIIPHPKFNPETRVNDIGLIRLKKRVDLSDYIRPICLPSRGGEFPTLGQLLYASGWGRQTFLGSWAEIKKKVKTNLIAGKACKNAFIGEAITENHMCTIDLPTNTEFLCEGDAGAPVMFASSKSQWHIEGIASWGGGCGPARLQVHTKVVNYIGWIKENVKLR